MPPAVTVLDRAEVATTATFIRGLQQPDGAIPWEAGRHVDPWDHVEAAMGLDVAGHHDAAAAAYDWLRGAQNPDGSWYRGYRAGQVSDPVRESNFTAYVAVGCWHHFLCTGDLTFLQRMWPVVAAAVEFTLALQAPGGEVWWARDQQGAPAREALLAGCASIHHSLRCAVATAMALGHPRPGWSAAADTLADAITAHVRAEAAEVEAGWDNGSGAGARFAPRHRFAMDWYYPVLGGVLRGPDAADRLHRWWGRFVVPGWGARCVSDQPWVTAAETSELVLSLQFAGWRAQAEELFAAVQRLRHRDGSYWTGYVVADATLWPRERTSWTAGSVLLAGAVLAGDPATREVFAAGAAPASAPHPAPAPAARAQADVPAPRPSPDGSITGSCPGAGAPPSRRSTRSDPVADMSTNSPEARAAW